MFDRLLLFSFGGIAALVIILALQQIFAVILGLPAAPNRMIWPFTRQRKATLQLLWSDCAEQHSLIPNDHVLCASYLQFEVNCP